MSNLLPIHYVHHIFYSYGYLLLPWLPVTVGVFNGRLRVVRGQYHDCTKTGIY